MKFALAASGVQAMKYPLIAQRAEHAGYESFWMPEHLIMPTEVPNLYPYTPGWVPPINEKTQLYDPWVTLGWVAAQTSTINLGTGVFILPLRHPIYTARQVATLDMLSQGRVLMGVGAGWQPQEFDYVGLGFKSRGRRMEECFEVLRKLWTERIIEHHGEFFDFGPCMFEPKPTRPGGPPIMVAGNSDVALRRAGQFGDGWVAHAPTFDECNAMVTKINTHRREFGRESAPFEFTSSLKKDTLDPITLEEAKRMEDIGIDRIQVTPWPSFGRKVSLEERFEAIDQFADQVIAKMN